MSEIEPAGSKGVGAADAGAQGCATGRREWHHLHLLIAWGVGVLGQSIVLPCLCYEGTVKGYVALIFDLLVLARMIVARVLHEQSRGWIFYAVLCYTSPLWLEGAARLFMAD